MKAFFFTVLLAAIHGCVCAQESRFTIYFPFNSSQIELAEAARIDSVLKTLQDKEVQSVLVVAHCDQVGKHRYNDSLSLARAIATRTALKDRGIAGRVDIQINGNGERQLVSEQWDEVSRQLNRRAEITIAYRTPILKRAEDSTENKLVATITDTAFKTGQTIVLRNINFYGGRHIVLAESRPALLELLEAMQRLPGLKIEIQGHICCATEAAEQFDGFDGWDIDTRQYRLSNNRARAIYNFLRENGISEERMSWKGFGYKHPLVTPERTDADRTTNRRVEIKILEK